MQRGRAEFCAYVPHGYSQICPYQDQESLLQHFLDRAAAGSRFASNLLRLTPCDLWPFFKGRTIWLLGDSLTQVPAYATADNLQQCSRRHADMLYASNFYFVIQSYVHKLCTFNAGNKHIPLRNQPYCCVAGIYGGNGMFFF